MADQTATGGTDPTPPDPGVIFDTRPPLDPDLERQREQLHSRSGITIWIELGRAGRKKGFGFKIAESDVAAAAAQLRGIFKQAVELAIDVARELAPAPDPKK